MLQTGLALAPAHGLGIMEHLAQSTQDAFAAHTGRQLATVHDGHSSVTGTWLGSLSWPHSPFSAASAAPQHLLWSQGCASGCPCYLVPSCPPGPCPEQCTTLRAAAPMPQAAEPAGVLLLLGPLQTVSPTEGLATWVPISRCHPASQHCQCCQLPCVPCRLRQGLGQVQLPCSAVSSHPGG